MQYFSIHNLVQKSSSNHTILLMTDLLWDTWEQMFSSIYGINSHRLKSRHHFFPRVPQQPSFYRWVQIGRISPYGSSLSVILLEFGFRSLNTPAHWDSHESQIALWRREQILSSFTMHCVFSLSLDTFKGVLLPQRLQGNW